MHWGGIGDEETSFCCKSFFSVKCCMWRLFLSTHLQQLLPWRMRSEKRVASSSLKRCDIKSGCWRISLRYADGTLSYYAYSAVFTAHTHLWRTGRAQHQWILPSSRWFMCSGAALQRTILTLKKGHEKGFLCRVMLQFQLCSMPFWDKTPQFYCKKKALQNLREIRRIYRQKDLC